MKKILIVMCGILLLEMLANSIDISWFFQGIENFKKTATRNIIVKTTQKTLNPYQKSSKTLNNQLNPHQTTHFNT